MPRLRGLPGGEIILCLRFLGRGHFRLLFRKQGLLQLFFT